MQLKAIQSVIDDLQSDIEHQSSLLIEIENQMKQYSKDNLRMQTLELCRAKASYRLTSAVVSLKHLAKVKADILEVAHHKAISSSPDFGRSN